MSMSGASDHFDLRQQAVNNARRLTEQLHRYQDDLQISREATSDGAKLLQDAAAAVDRVAKLLDDILFHPAKCDPDTIGSSNDISKNQ
jgi:hypothetical protein